MYRLLSPFIFLSFFAFIKKSKTLRQKAVGACRLSAVSHASEKGKEDYILVVIVVFIGGVGNVENSKKSDGVYVFRHFFIHIVYNGICEFECVLFSTDFSTA